MVRQLEDFIVRVLSYADELTTKPIVFSPSSSSMYARDKHYYLSVSLSLSLSFSLLPHPPVY